MRGRGPAGRAALGRPRGDGGAGVDGLVLGAVAATVAGMVVQELIGFGSRPLPLGRVVTIEGRSQHVLDRKGSRRPTVVFESGLGNPVTMWLWVFDHLPKDTHLVGYDRPGIGWSKPRRAALDGSRYPDHLLSVLRAAGAPPPYLLVGHSVGGLLIRLFAQRHPQLTAGLVLVDSTHPAEILGSSPLDGSNPMQGRLDRWIARAALGMSADESLTAELASLPPMLVGPTTKAKTGVGSLWAARRELGLSQNWAAGCDGMSSFSPWPVAVVSAATGLEQKAGFAEYQDDLTRLSEVSRSYHVAKATHQSLLTDREHAERVAEAVVWALDRAPQPPGHSRPPLLQNGGLST